MLCWRSFAHTTGVDSVPRYLEEHAERVRDRYLTFIRVLGEYRIAGRSVVEHLDPGDGCSLWWMTLLAEKSPLKSPRIYDCLRLIALYEMLAADRPSGLRLVSSDRDLAAAVAGLCRSLSLPFRWQRGRTSRPRPLRRLYTALPAVLQGALSLRHTARRWALRTLRTGRWFAGSRAAFFCSYFVHLDPGGGAHGQFHSRHWEALPPLLHESGIRTNWLQLFMSSAAVPEVGAAIIWARSFNRDCDHQGQHTFLDSYLSCSVLWRALRIWCWLNRVQWRLVGLRAAFVVPGTTVSLWPLLRRDWVASLSGPTGVSNCLCVALFDAALAEVPRQQLGLYLWENQAWEAALLRAWRRHGHGRIIGVQHSTTPFWYLPHVRDSREGGSAGLPDALAVNGRAARAALEAAGFPPERLAEVEALRYLGLGGAARGSGVPLAARAGAGPRARQDRALEVLVLGDIAPSSMHHLLRLLEDAVGLLPAGFTFTFKAHPAYQPGLADYPRLQLARTDRALADLLGDFDMAVAANSTSAAVDAFVAGLPVIVGLHGGSLNLSPLRGHAGARFVSTGRGLADALLEQARAGAAPAAPQEFFFLDPTLPRWRSLLGVQ